MMLFLRSQALTKPTLGPRKAPLAGGQLAGALLLCGLAISLAACERPRRLPTMQVLAGQTMGTTYSIKLISGAESPALPQISKEIEAELDEVNAQMSTYLTTSELSRFNNQTSDQWFPVSRSTAEVVQMSLQLWELTEGAFDVTVGPLVDLWGFGPGGRIQQPPSTAAIAETLQVVGSEKLSVRLQPPALRKSVGELRVDLSAIAKGHGVDRCAQVLDSLQVEAYFIEIGGEVRTKGRKPDGTAWQVGIERPTSDQRSIERVLPLLGQSLATSGSYRNFFEVDGRRYAHTINPRTGRPVEDSIASASVVAEQCALADGIATAMMSMGYEAGLELADSQGWSVLLVRPNADGGFQESASPAFQSQFVK